MAIPTPQPGSAALITGASSGIGAELARQICARGHDAILVARRKDRLDTLADDLRAAYGCRVEVLACDLADAEARDRLPTEIDALALQVNVLLLCAGFGMGGPFISQAPERIVGMVRTNVEAVFALSRAFVPAMTERRAGAVLIVSSMAGNQPMPHFAAYSATKAAVTSFAESLHAELAADSVTVTALTPGPVATEFSKAGGMSQKEDAVPGPLLIEAEECARAGLDALDRGRRIVVPRRSVRVLAFVAARIPRAIWLPLSRRFMT